jgi:hypothetical protein
VHPYREILQVYVNPKLRIDRRIPIRYFGFSEQSEEIYLAGKTSAKAINKYMNKTYDKLVVLLPKGDKEKLHKFCDTKGTSMSRLAADLLGKYMEENE